MRKLKLVVAYEGTAYVGWQRQAIGSSIQGCLETALGVIDGGAVDAVGAGRTDAGVHALGQVVSVRLRRHIAVDAFVRGVNSKLPDDIRLLAAEPTRETDNPTETAGRMPLLNKSVSRKICPSVMEITLVGIYPETSPICVSMIGSAVSEPLPLSLFKRAERSNKREWR